MLFVMNNVRLESQLQNIIPYIESILISKFENFSRFHIMNIILANTVLFIPNFATGLTKSFNSLLF